MGIMGSKRLPTLDVFIQQAIARGTVMPSVSWVQSHGFAEMYVRLTARYVDGKKLAPVLDLANMTVKEPGKGTFTRLIERLRKEYPTLHIFVEQTHERFGAYLLKLNFIKLDPLVHGESYLLKAGA